MVLDGRQKRPIPRRGVNVTDSSWAGDVGQKVLVAVVVCGVVGCLVKTGRRGNGREGWPYRRGPEGSARSACLWTRKVRVATEAAAPKARRMRGAGAASRCCLWSCGASHCPPHLPIPKSPCRKTALFVIFPSRTPKPKQHMDNSNHSKST